MMEREKLHIRAYETTDEKDVVGLWGDCGLVVAWNDPKMDIGRKMKVDRELFLVGLIDGEIVATVMGGYEGHRGWINYLAVSGGVRLGGVGREMVAEVEGELRKRGCPKINIQIRSSNKDVIEFYGKIGFVADDVISMGKRLVDDI